MNIQIGFPRERGLPYQLSNSEEKVLGLQKAQSKSAAKSDGRGIKREQKSGEYKRINKKIEDALARLEAFTKHLDRMDDGKFADAKRIKEVTLTPMNFQVILENILMSQSISKAQKRGFVEFMFNISTEHILKDMDDPVYRDYVQTPVKIVKKRLSKISEESRKNWRLREENSLYERRLASVNNFANFGQLAGEWNVACKGCCVVNHAKTKEAAVYGLDHDGLCRYKSDIRKEIKETLSHYFIAKPGK